MLKTPLDLICSALVAVCLAGCPYDATAAGLTAGDGGVWLGSPSDGGVFVPLVQDAGVPFQLPRAPSTQTLCMLVIGKYKNDDNPRARPPMIGTWIGDVESSIFFGPPPPNAEQLGTDTAQLSYHWPGGGIQMQFQWVQAYKVINGKLSWDAWPRSFFLSDISMEGVPKYQDCWRPLLNYPGHIDCTQCSAWRNFNTCDPYPCDD